MSTVHPHVRGEYVLVPGLRDPRIRSTPTCVGNTRSSARASRSLSVHPHVRGEYRVLAPNGSVYVGPPPRAWGIRCRPSVSRGLRLVHPHVRGEYPAILTELKSHSGPPPRAWGIPSDDKRDSLTLRSTPTCVGNTRGQSYKSIMAPVHPHVRGEYYTLRRGHTWADGPPPRAWGILLLTMGRRCRIRSTPTCVGNTRTCASRAPKTAVHPHVRGEYRPHRIRYRQACGPPPRAWGIQGNALKSKTG